VIATEYSNQNSIKIFSFQVDNKTNRMIWSILAFHAGAINAGGFLACHRFVTHTTGFATQLGYDIAATKWHDAVGMLTVPLFFMGGSMISGYYVDRRIQLNQQPRFHTLFLMSSLFMAFVSVFGSIGLFGTFNQEFDIATSYLLIALLCLTSGMQNAMTTSGSVSNVRTTHLTGHTTDLGISLVKSLAISDPERLKIERNKNQVRILVIGAFILGSVISTFLFLKFNYWGFLLPAFISFALYITSKKDSSQNARLS
jgi:uncharacterized membrane protein YoaK (UPF0700 family)